MKKLLFTGLAVALLMPALATAQSALNGTWKIDVNKVQTTRKPVVVTLKDGMYHCTCSVPPFTVKADGADHAVSGHPSYDTVAIQVVDDHTIRQTSKKKGKTVAINTLTVAADSKTATNEFTDTGGTTPVTGKMELVRVSSGAPGSNAVNGSWRIGNYDSISANGLTTTYKVEGDRVSMSDPVGDAYTAKLDGSDAPYQGDPGITSVSVKKLGKNSLQETDKRDGKVVSVSTMTVSADGKTLKTVSHNRLDGATTTLLANRQ